MANPDGVHLPISSYFQPRKDCQTMELNGTRQLPSNRNLGYTCTPPLPTDPSGIYSSLVTDSDLTLAKKKFIKVSGIGEVEFEPDRIDFVIQITSVKPEVKEARESIRKRSDYIMAALRKNHFNEWEINSSERVTKMEANLQDEHQPTQHNLPDENHFKLIKEINVHCDNLLKYHNIYSICNEKLDQFVVISEPIVKFSSSVIQLNTQRAIRQAVSNSHIKATELLGPQTGKTPNSSLGQMIYTVEDSLTIQSLDEYENSNFESFKWKSLNKRLTCQITSVFEISDRIK